MSLFMALRLTLPVRIWLTRWRTILSVAMMLRYSLDEAEMADKVEAAVSTGT